MKDPTDPFPTERADRIEWAKRHVDDVMPPRRMFARALLAAVDGDHDSPYRGLMIVGWTDVMHQSSTRPMTNVERANHVLVDFIRWLGERDFITDSSDPESLAIQYLYWTDD